MYIIVKKVLLQYKLQKSSKKNIADNFKLYASW